MTTRKRILITGGSGRQGGAVARCLLEKGQPVRVMTRSPDRAEAFRRLGAEVARGDFEDQHSIDRAVTGCDGVFLVGTSTEKGSGGEVRHGEAMVAACWKAGVSHVVYSSIASADRHTGIPHFESKRRIEGFLDEAGQPRTILRPVFFMENLEAPRMLSAIRGGSFATPLLPDRRVQMVSVSDIGEFASEAFLRPVEFIGKTIELAGDELTMAEAAAMISRVLGIPVRYMVIPDGEAERAVGPDLAPLFRWLNREGHRVDIDGLRQAFRIPLATFSRYLERPSFRRKAA